MGVAGTGLAVSQLPVVSAAVLVAHSAYMSEPERYWPEFLSPDPDDSSEFEWHRFDLPHYSPWVPVAVADVSCQ